MIPLVCSSRPGMPSLLGRDDNGARQFRITSADRRPSVQYRIEPRRLKLKIDQSASVTCPSNKIAKQRMKFWPKPLTGLGYTLKAPQKHRILVSQNYAQTGAHFEAKTSSPSISKYTLQLFMNGDIHSFPVAYGKFFFSTQN